MALNSKVIAFVKATSTGNQSITGAGFQGRAAVFFTAGAATTNTWISSPVSTLGYAAQNSSNGYSYGSISWSTQNGSDPTVSSRRASDSVMAFLRYDGTLRDEADFVSFDSDGLTINWTTASADSRLIYVLILGGSDLTDAEVVNFARSTSTGNQTVTGAGFTPDSMLLSTTCNSSTYNTNGGTSANFSFGACDGTSQFLTTVVDANGQATAATAKGHRNNAIAGAIDASGTYTTLGAWTSFNSDGCVINWSVNQGTAGRMCALFLKGCNATVRTAAKANGGTSSIISGGAMSYQATAAIFASTWGGTLTGSGTSQLHYSFGISDCNGGDMGMAFNSVDAAATQFSQAVQVSTKSIIKVTENSTTNTKAAEGTIGSYNNGIDAYYSTADSSTANFSYICFGPKEVKDVTNHAQNPNFETNTTGWTPGNASAARITSDSYAGSACLRATITSTATTPYIIHNSTATDVRRIPAVSGDIVYASAWVKAGNSGAVGQEVKLQARGFDSSNSTAVGAAQLSSGVNLTTSWQQLTLTTTGMPANTYGIQFLIRFELTGLNTTDEILIDQVEIRINQPFDTYVDGSQGTYHSWLGVTNDSRSIRSKIVKTSEFTADALLVNENTKEFTGDGIMFFTDNKEFTADALLVIVGTQEFTGDALVTGEFSSEFTSDGYIDFTYVENDIEFTSDAVVVEHISVFSDDFEDGLDTGWSYTAGVTEPFGLLAFDPTIGTTDPETAYNTTSYFLDEAVIKVDNLGNMRAIIGVEDAISGNIIAFDLDLYNAAVINFSVYDSNTTTWNSYDSVSTSSDNWYKVSYDGTDVIWSTSADGHSWTDHYNTTISEDFDFGNSRYYFSFEKSTNPTWPAYSNLRIESIGLVEYGFTADGYVVEVNNSEFTGDSLVVEVNNSEFTASGIVQATATSDFTSSAIIFATGNSDFTADGEVTAGSVVTNTKEFTASGNVSGAIGTKLYATSSSAIWSGDPLSYKGSWTQANFFRYLMSEDLDSIGPSVARALAETTTSNPNTAGLIMFTSPPLSTNQTISGMLDFVLGMRESNAAANMSIQVHAYVTAGDTTTVRGTLVSNWNEPSTNEFTTTGMGYGVTGQIPCSTVNAQAGDFIIVEVGFYAANSSATSYNGTIYNGAVTNPVELTVGNSNVTTRAGWIGFTQDLQFTYISRVEAFTADAVIGQTNTKEVTASGIVKAETTKEFTGSGLVFIGDQTKEFTGSGLLQQTPISEFTASGLVQQSPTYEITADSIIFATSTNDFTGDSILLEEQTLDIDSSALVLDTFDLEVSASALVRDTLTLDLDSDSILQDTIDLDVSASAIVLSTVELDVISSGILQDTLVSEVTADARVVIPVIINFTSDATIFATEFKEVSADAELVGAPGTVIATQVILSDIMGELMVINDTFGSTPFVASDISTTVRVLKGGNE